MPTYHRAADEVSQMARGMDFQELNRKVRLDLRRSHFSDRDKLILEEVLDLTFAAGRPSARIPGLAYFTARTGITKGNVHASLERLVRSAALLVRGDRYQVLPHSQVNPWRVAQRTDAAQADAAWAEVDRLNRSHQLELLAPIPDLDDAKATVCMEAAQSPTQTEQENTGDWIAGVPESGTIAPFPNQEPRSTVPESGTLCTTVKRSHRLTALQEQSNSVPVPVNRGREAELMDLIQQCVGADDFAYWSGDWRVNWVRRYPPSSVEAACREMLANAAEGRTIRARHAYLKDLIRRFSPGAPARESGGSKPRESGPLRNLFG